MSERSHSTHTQIIPSELQLARGLDFTHTLENFGLDCSTYDYSIIIFFKNTILEFSLCCVKVRSLRQLIIYYPNFMFDIFVSFE